MSDRLNVYPPTRPVLDIYFFAIALEELKYYFIVAKDLGYASTTAMIVQSEVVGRLLNGFIESTERRR